MRTITGTLSNPSVLLQKVHEQFFSNYCPSESTYPNGCCTHCYNILQRKQTEKLPDIVDFSNVTSPNTRQRPHPKDDSVCTTDCSLCTIERTSCGTPGNNFGNKKRKNQGPYPLGRTASTTNDSLTRLPLRKPVVRCDRCQRIWGK